MYNNVLIIKKVTQINERLCHLTIYESFLSYEVRFEPGKAHRYALFFPMEKFFLSAYLTKGSTIAAIIAPNSKPAMML